MLFMVCIIVLFFEQVEQVFYCLPKLTVISDNMFTRTNNKTFIRKFIKVNNRTLVRCAYCTTSNHTEQLLDTIHYWTHATNRYMQIVDIVE